MKTITIKDTTISLSDDDLVELKKQLEEKTRFPNWEDIGEISWFFVDSEEWYVTDCYKINNYEKNSNWIRPTKELCEASIALAKLMYLRDIANDWLIPNRKYWNAKYCIYNENGISIWWLSRSAILSFKDEETRNWFLGAYKDLITIALPLI